MRIHLMNALKGVTLTFLLVTAAASHAQDTRYPAKPIRFIVPASAGGPSDVIARLVAERLGQSLGQTVLVDNRPGASQMLGTAAVSKADPDGYTLLFTTSTPIVMVPATLKKVPYDVQKDLTAISHIGTTPLVLYVNGTTAITNLRQLFDEVKAKPESANYGSYGNGSSAHVLGEFMIRQANVKMVHVPYKGVAPELQDLLGGQLMTAVADIGSASALIKAGKIRPIAVTGSKRSEVLPDVATFAEQGIAGMEPFSPWWGVFAPRLTPKPIVDQLSAEIAKIVKAPDFNAKLVSFGIDTTGTTSAQANELARAETIRWQQITRDMSHISFE